MERKPEFRIAGRITVDQENIDLSKLGEGECFTIMDGDVKVGYLCRVGNQFKVYKENEIKIRE